jgi:DNA-binding MarR family transcriptional regulator
MAASPTTYELETAQRLRVVFGRLSRLLRPTDAGSAAELTPTRVSVLLNAVRNGPIRLAEIAAEEGLNPTLLSRTVAHLVAGGLLERSADSEDRRSAWIDATADGRKLAERIRRQRTEAVEAALGELSEGDRELVVRALPALEALAEQLKDVRA